MAIAARDIVLHDGVRLEVVESAGKALHREMDPRLRGGDGGKRGDDGGKHRDGGLEVSSFPRKRESIPLLLLHGFTGAASTWSELLPEFGARRRAIALSLHGHGGSDAPDDPARYAATRAAADVLEVLDMLGIARVALLGYSMGARVALHTALAAPERVGALILESGSPGIADDAERAERRAADDALAMDIEHHGVEAFVDRWERLPLWESQRQLAPSIREGLRAQRLAGRARGLANSLRGLGAGATAPLHGKLGELRDAPVLLICGALDAKYVELAREMSEALPRSTMHVVEGAGHAVHLERPHELLGAVDEFLMEVESASPSGVT
ncbi:MAG TPA: 2-succinyl-6-hydroxy-2,4-cyclohexadiene-1-carboxylate synthase [Gemmatimonadaceae bacterium]|nr:2-succinyl-6-hydroxy-2,4-cyclohexadiene-1-carboxylate synthase [Gemmatimonadaceae bacterium]